MYTESYTHKRQPFDLNFYQEVGGDATALDLILNTATDSNGDPEEAIYDLNEDGDVDKNDLQALIDFARGLHTAEFPALNQERGSWKLGDLSQFRAGRCTKR